MIPELEQKYLQLNEAQKEIFRGYGLRQIKHFVELSLPKIENCLPHNSSVIGINSIGQIQAVNIQTQQIFLWISDQQWQESKAVASHVDRKEDFIEVWKIFDLQSKSLIELSHVHRDFLESNLS